MRKLTSPVVAAFAMLLATACSGDMPSSPEVSRQASTLYYDCSADVDNVCFSANLGTPSDTIPALKRSHLIFLGENGVLAFIVNAEDVNIVGTTQAWVATVTGPSDTIPSPAPPGPVRAFYQKNGGSSFAAILKSAGAAGIVPSDTIPGPGPIGNVKLGNYDSDAGQEYAIWVSIKNLSDSKAISATTTGLRLVLGNGKSFVASQVVPVSIIGPEKDVTHL